MKTPRTVSLLLGSLAALSRALHAQERDIADLDLATLMTMDVTVTSAARRAQVSSDAAAAVFVITREDIRRSGATSIPELLRFVPGLEVARATNNRWAVTARGFNSRFANKLLVLIDGRSIYTQQFSGVLWETHHVPLEEIERIEVIRGPGGALWGANAVNGIINIITRSAAEGAGLELNAGGGDEDRDSASIHFGGVAAGTGAYRAYAEHFQRDSFVANKEPWRHWQGGWRLDGKAGADSTYTIQGDVIENDLGTIPDAVGAPTPLKDLAANVNAYGERPAFADGRLAWQSSYSYRAGQRFNIMAEREQTVELNLQYNAQRRGRHLLTMGTGWRLTRDDLQSAPDFVEFDVETSTRDLENIFAQDEIFFHEDKVRVTLGGKLEHYEFSGTAFQPTARALWHLTDQHTVWSAYSKAVRTPSRFERGAHILIVTLPDNPPTRIYIDGNSSLQEEHLSAKELGWRWRPTNHLSFDVVLYDNRYRDLIVSEQQPVEFVTTPTPGVNVTQKYFNQGSADSRGAGLSLDWIASSVLRFHANGMWLNVDAPGTRIGGALLEGADPKNTYTLQARFNLPRRMEADLSYRYVSSTPAFGISDYDSVGARLGAVLGRSWSVSLSGENLLNNSHREIPNEEEGFSSETWIGRSVFLRASWDSKP